MHQEPADKLLTGNRHLLPPPLVFIIFGSERNGKTFYTFDAVITDSDSVCVFAKVLNDRLRTMERLLTVRDPFFLVIGIQ